MKVRSSIRKICPSCKLVRRGRKQFVICPANARHKQRQGLHTLAGAELELGGAGAQLSPLATTALTAVGAASGAAATRPTAAQALATLRAFSTGDMDDDL